MSIINTNINELNNIKTDFSNLIIRYDNLVNLYFQRINGIHTETKEWVGDDADLFIEKINKDKKIYDNIGTILKSYNNTLDSLLADFNNLISKDGM